jgi:competence protein ComEC
MGIILPLALLIVFLPSVPFLLSIYHSAFSFCIFVFRVWADFSASLPFYFDCVYLTLPQIVLVYSLLLSGLFFYQSKSRKTKISYCSAFVILLIVLLATFRQPVPTAKITFFDCGLGDLALIETLDGKNIMIDSGPTERSYGNCNQSALPYCRKNGINTIDLLFITHAHNDHYGGLESLLQQMDIKFLAITDEFINREVWLKFHDDIKNENCKIVTVSDTMSFYFKDFSLKIIHPDRKFYHENINNNSLVIRADFGEFEVLFTGDLELEGEEYLLQKYPSFLPADFLKVGHHGSKTACGQKFIDAVNPDFAFISTSLHNKFDFPHPRTLSTLSFLDNRLFISGRDGAVQLLINNDEVFIISFLSDKTFRLKLN